MIYWPIMRFTFEQLKVGIIVNYFLIDSLTAAPNNRTPLCLLRTLVAPTPSLSLSPSIYLPVYVVSCWVSPFTQYAPWAPPEKFLKMKKKKLDTLTIYLITKGIYSNFNLKLNLYEVYLKGDTQRINLLISRSIWRSAPNW